MRRSLVRAARFGIDLKRWSPLPAMSEAPQQPAYYDHDFDHEELLAEGAAYRERFASIPERSAEAAAAAASSGAKWERFYAKHDAKFFKPRHFILSAFPSIATAGAAAGAAGKAYRVLECGAGNASNVLPLLQRLPSAHVYATDIAQSALQAMMAHPVMAEYSGRVTAFQYDIVSRSYAPVQPKASGSRSGVSGGSGGKGEGAGSAAAATSDADAEAADAAEATPFTLPSALAGGMDAAFLTFVLSAIHPKDHAAAVTTVAGSLRPGGYLAFRDYGLYDLAQLRAGAANRLTDKLHVRGDGTLSYYFEPEEVRELLTSAGLTVLECSYATIRNVNKAKGLEMRRVFLHALAQRPEAASP